MKTQMTTTKRPRVMTWAMMILAGFALLLTAHPAAAQRGGGSGQGDPAFQMKRHLAGLDLTEEQQKKVDEIIETRRDVGLKLRAEQTRLRAELQAEMLKEEPNTNRIYGLIDAMTKIHGDIQKNRIDQRLAVGKVLTVEQRAKMTTMAGRGLCGMGGSRMGRGHRGGRGDAVGCCGHGGRARCLDGPPQCGAGRFAGRGMYGR